MKRFRIWVQYIVDGDIAEVMEVGTDSGFNGNMVWDEVKIAMKNNPNIDLIKHKQYRDARAIKINL